MIDIPTTVTMAGVRYLAEITRMRKQIGTSFYKWGVPIGPAQGSAVYSTNAGNVAAGDYLVHIVPVSTLGKKANPWKTDSNPDPIEVTVDLDGKTIDVTIPIHGDPHIKYQTVYRTLVDEISPFYYAGVVTNGTTSLTLNGNDASLATTDFLEGPFKEETLLTGPFRYGRPPAKAICELVMSDIIMVCGEEEYTEGYFSATEGSAVFTGTGAVHLTKDMEGKSFRFSDESTGYAIASVDTSQRFTATAAYVQEPWRGSDPSEESYEIIGDPTEVAPSIPGEPEYFGISDRFNVGQDDGGRIKGLIGFAGDALFFTEETSYLVSKSSLQGIYNVVGTGATYGCTAKHSLVLANGGCIHFAGDDICWYYNGRSIVISDELGDMLRNSVQDGKKYAISAVSDNKLYFAFAYESTEFLDRIAVLDLDTLNAPPGQRVWDVWTSFRIVDMKSIVAPTGRQFLYIEIPAGNGYALMGFTNAAYNDGAGGFDYSGSVVTATSKGIETSAQLPTDGLGVKGIMVRIASGTGEGQERWIESNTTNSVAITEAWTTIPDSTSTYTIGAISIEALGGKLGLSTGHLEQDVKHSELRMGG